MTSKKSGLIFYSLLVLILGGLLIIFLTPTYTDMCSQDLLVCLQEDGEQSGLSRLTTNLGCAISNFGCVIKSFFGSWF